jgi:opacity protein-like surface antigen
MSRVHFARVLFVLLLLVASTPVLQAQAWEAYAFAGGTTHGGNVNFNDAFDSRARMPGAFTTGGKVGGFISENFSLDGNLSWYNHMFRLSNRSDVVIFQPITNTTAGIAGLTGNEVKTRALLWEMSGNYDFGEHTLGTRWTPYVTLGVGGMTARIKNLLPAAASLETRCTSTRLQRCNRSLRIQ